MRYFELLTATAMMVAVAGCATASSVGQNKQAACYADRHDYTYPYHGYNGYDYPGTASPECGGGPAPAAVAFAAPVQTGAWNGELSGQSGANSAGGGNRGSHMMAPEVSLTAPAPAGLWDGQFPEPTGANTAGGGNRY